MQLFFFFFAFFSFAHTGKDIGQGTKKKKRPSVFFQTPSGHWAINAQWDSVWPLGHKCPVGQCEDGSCQKKKRKVVLLRPQAATWQLPKKKKRKVVLLRPQAATSIFIAKVSR